MNHDKVILPKIWQFFEGDKVMARFALIAVVVYLMDLFSKIFIRARFSLEKEVKVLPIFSVIHVQNTGIAFGLFPGRNLVFIFIGLLMSGFLIWLAWSERIRQPLFTYSLALILGGAWGNLTDRIARGFVTDFLDFYWGTHHWPAFNVADSTICIGAFLLIALNVLTKKQNHVTHSF